MPNVEKHASNGTVIDGVDFKDVKNMIASFKKEVKQDVSSLVSKSVISVLEETKKKLAADSAKKQTD